MFAGWSKAHPLTSSALNPPRIQPSRRLLGFLHLGYSRGVVKIVNGVVILT